MSMGSLVPQFFSSTFLGAITAPGSFSDCGGGVGGAVVAWGVFFQGVLCVLVLKLLPPSWWGPPGKKKVAGKLWCPPGLRCL